MDANTATKQNGNSDHGILPTSPDLVLTPKRQDSLSESLLDSSELTDETDIETMRQRIHEMEEEAEKLKQMQFEVEKQMQTPGSTGSGISLSSSFFSGYLFSYCSN